MTTAVEANEVAAAPAGDRAGEVAYAPLSPLRYLQRSAIVWAGRPAVVYGDLTVTYADHYQRVRRACGALAGEVGVKPGDRVATLLPNVPAMLELHYAVPGAGGILVPLNTRLAAAEYEYIVGHSGATVIVAFEGLRPALEPALEALGGDAPRVYWVGAGGERGTWDEVVDAAEPRPMTLPADETSLLSINYTSGTTGRSKGVMTTHRGAYLHSLGVVAEAALTPSSVYLWTLPMFHCNGWAYPWAVTSMGARHVCLERVEPGPIWKALQSEGVTHLCAAPTVLSMLVGAEEAAPLEREARIFVGGAPPAPALIERAAGLNIAVTHLYGLTETYGPIAVCAWNPEWDLRPDEEQFRLRARQGVGTVVSERLRVVDDNMADVPADGETIGEIVMRGNNVMVGYYRDPEATAEAFKGGWFHSGDLGVMHPDGYVELRDRLKDIVISGGENIATVEVEQALAAHPDVSEAAVVGAPDERWGEVPVAFVTARGGRQVDGEDVRQFARDRIAHFKVPKRIMVVDELPKTSTGKIQKFLLRERLKEGAAPA
jgi:fatty-acyl-CoA synthase